MATLTTKKIVEYTAALWALLFGLFHVVWAAGWYIGLDPVESEIAFSNPWMLAYDLFIAIACFIAVPVAILFVEPLGKRIPRKLINLLAWSGTSLLLLRAGASVLQTTYLIITAEYSFTLRTMAWEAWFYLGAVLWGVSVWRFRTAKKLS
ncbi:MAG: hypothetical protein L0Y80_11205 [Ignavibacteriae bacterium]|nr:hypothetical protein [Ignavibacteriota bacterium]